VAESYNIVFNNGAPQFNKMSCQILRGTNSDPGLIQCEKHVEFLITFGHFPPMLALPDGIIITTTRTTTSYLMSNRLTCQQLRIARTAY